MSHSDQQFELFEDRDLLEHFNHLILEDNLPATIEIDNKTLFGRCRKDKSKILTLFRSNKGILSDVIGVDYNKHHVQKNVFLEKLGSEFVDTLIVVCPVNSEEFDKNGESPKLCSEYNKRICSLFDKYGLKGVSVKVIGNSRYADYTLIPKSVYTEYKETCPKAEKWQDGYLKFKLDTNKFSLDEIFDVIENEDMWKVAAKNFVFHKELDVTQDYSGSMNRNAVEQLLLDAGYATNISAAVAFKMGAPGLILDNAADVGNNCITWLEFRGVFVLRKKLYLKVIQMLESASVRMDIGTNIHNLVANEDAKFQEKLVNAKEHGITRLECTFYVNKVFEKNVYKKELENMLALVNKPIFYVTPFEGYWKALAECIVSSMFIYAPKTKEFAYCQWINSLTGKIQGMYKESIERDDMEWFRGAYSFNNRPIYYLEIDLTESGCHFLKQEIYFRGEDAITLVPGPKKSLFPSKQTTIAHFQDFANMGFTNQSNIELNWPEKKKDSRYIDICKTSFHGTFEFAMRNGKVAERELKNKETRAFVEKIMANIQEKHQRKQETYAKLLKPLGDSKYLYTKLLRECQPVRSSALTLGVPYHMHGYYHNGNGHHYMLYNPADERFYACVLSNPQLDVETTNFLRLVPNTRQPVLYTCGKPFLYITPRHLKADSNKNVKCIIDIERVETDDEIRKTLREFFAANAMPRENKTINILSAIKTANYKPDNTMLKLDECYVVLAYGTKEWRNVERFFVIVKNVCSNAELKIKAGRNLADLIKEKTDKSIRQFRFKVVDDNFQHKTDNTRDICVQADLV